MLFVLFVFTTLVISVLVTVVFVGGLVTRKTVVVETMDDAIALAKQNSYSFRIVTTQGDLINPSGAITGGSVAQKTVNILGRKQEIEKLEKTINEQTKKIDNIENQKNEYIASVESILEQATNLETALQETQIDYATKKQKLTTTEENIEKLETKLQKTKDEITNIENEIKEKLATFRKMFFLEILSP